ncbi:hypothetical protein PJF56_09295 [Roseofilum sp. BLCC_M91]|uniref:Uncharacterized protein n=1 Tax=Roseofilum halophilum BLCC-M91 TaxID=3022259 RepID=A0ABT7BKF4_9CYAN|nr:hypothetical protein [Roseofilum halophilum]MDJ1179059.1 hypothetical protein [Roseofilum halophilum BLCC-M91]
MKSQERMKTETDRQHIARLIGDAANNLDTANDLRFEVQVPANSPVSPTDDPLVASIRMEYGITIFIQILILLIIWFRGR